MTAARVRIVQQPPEPTPISKGGLPQIPVGVIIAAASFCAGIVAFAVLTLGVLR